MIRAAVALLTRFPMRASDIDGPGAAAFPLVGALVGALGGLACFLLSSAEPALAAIAAIAVMAICSGGLHLDGLADTADALAATDPQGSERARRDPALGPTGAATLILILGGQIAALASLAGRPEGPLLAVASCVVAAALGRTVPVVGARLFGGSRTATEGFGAWFTARVTRTDAGVALLSAGGLVVAAAVLAGDPRVVVGASVGVFAGGLSLAAIVAARGQLDGDGLGAGIELTVAATLAAMAVIA